MSAMGSGCTLNLGFGSPEVLQDLEDGAADPIYGRECVRQAMQAEVGQPPETMPWGEPYVVVEAEYEVSKEECPDWTDLRPAAAEEMMWRCADHAVVAEQSSEGETPWGGRFVWYFDEDDQLRAMEWHWRLWWLEDRPWAIVALWEDPSRYRVEGVPIRSSVAGAPSVASVFLAGYCGLGGGIQ